jgi:hypothetical protein
MIERHRIAVCNSNARIEAAGLAHRTPVSRPPRLATVPFPCQSTAPSGLPSSRPGAMLGRMGTKSRGTIYGASVRAAAERAAEASTRADKLACEAWNKRMLAFQGPAPRAGTLRRKLCSEERGYPYMPSHLVALRPNKISAQDPSTWWPGER